MEHENKLKRYNDQLKKVDVDLNLNRNGFWRETHQIPKKLWDPYFQS